MKEKTHSVTIMLLVVVILFAAVDVFFRLAPLADANSMPVADAGPDQVVYVNEVVQFDGSGSYDVDGPWEIGTLDSTGVVGGYTSIAVDSTGNPHISYHDYDNNNLKYAKRVGGSWSNETVDSTGPVGQAGSPTSIALDSIDRPHISYYQNDDRDLKYAQWNGSDWNIEIVDSTGDVGQDSSIAIDGDGHPHISYLDSTNSDLKYAHWTGIAWNISTVDSQFATGFLTSLALDSSDNPHISYAGSGVLKYAIWNGISWSLENVTSIGMHVSGGGISLALDDSDYPHIAFTYYSAIGSLRYGVWNGSDWGINTVDDSEDTGYEPSIALNLSGFAQISYTDNVNHDLKLACNTGISWTNETIDSTGDVGRHSSIDVDAFGFVHISYLDNTNFDLKYTRRSNDIVSYEWVFGDGSPNGTGANPSHIYNFTGVYDVTLTVTDSDGNSDSDVCTVTVVSPPNYTFYVGGVGSGNYTTIQEGVDAASPGDTVFVYNGTYNEDVIVNKSVTLCGENRDITIINGSGTENVVKITSDSVNVSGFTITNSKADLYYAGIKLTHVDNCEIFSNKILSNEIGMRFEGSSFNEIKDNMVSSNNMYGFYLEAYGGMSSNNDIINNTIAGNTEGICMISPGTELFSSCNIINNTISGNTGKGIHFETSIGNNILYNNISNNGGGIFPWLSSYGNQIIGNNIAGNAEGIWIDASYLNNIVDNNITGNNIGIIQTSFSSSNEIKNNNISSNSGCAISLSWSGFNVITGNLISYNDRSFELDFLSPENYIYHNNIIGNNLPPNDDNSTNIWNDTYPLGGNYWSDYSGVDLFKGPNQNIPGKDGIGDTAYIIDPDSRDNYPLMGPYPSFPSGNYTVLKSGWNLISIPLIQAEQNLTMVLGAINTWYNAVKWYNNSDRRDPWKHNYMGKPFGNDLCELNESMGIWIHITQPGTTLFLYNGTQPTHNQSIQLKQGWNMVGYPSLSAHNQTAALNNLVFGTHVDSVWAFDAATQSWEELGPSDDFELGHGYWIHATQDCLWEVPL